MSETYFRRGFGLKATVGPVLAKSYHSPVVDRLKELGYVGRAGDVVLKLAREFGFCYGVDRAVEYAYETRERFPDRRIFLSGEIIHNPDVNARLQSMGIRSLAEAEGDAPEKRYAEVAPEDVVILPAFGVTVSEFNFLRAKRCVLVDTTCGSVLSIWKNVHKYARDGFTSVIHGKRDHEETKATASQALTDPGGQYLCVRNKVEAELVCRFIRGEVNREAVLDCFRDAASPGFDPDRHLLRLGLANQTTMLMSESVAIQEMFRAAIRDRYGEEALAERFRAFDTICSATQDRQDAVIRLLQEANLDLMIVIGGYNSSNTQALASICAEKLPTYHIRSAEGIERSGIRYRSVGSHQEAFAADWLPLGPVVAGLTAGASTPNNVVGNVVERVLALRGQTVDQLAAAVPGPPESDPTPRSADCSHRKD